MQGYDCYCDFSFSDVLQLVEAPSDLKQESFDDVAELARYIKDYANVIEISRGQAWVIKIAGFEECQMALPEKPKEFREAERPATQEIEVKAEREFTKMVPVTDAPDTGLERGEGERGSEEVFISQHSLKC